MILDSDILSYFDSISVDVKYEEGEESTFTFLVSYREFDIDCSLILDHSESSVAFVLKFIEPKTLKNMSECLNTLCLNTPFKAYYDRIIDTVFVEASSFVTEENIINILEYYINSLVEEDYQYIENLYNSIYKEDNEPTYDDSKDESLDDTTIEEDLAELMSLLGKV